ncbi:MAG TPA: hypothetical protein VHM31_24510 [Polyangia bacterium]|nr:hypothetical protein [Polyangia bacterium]
MSLSLAPAPTSHPVPYAQLYAGQVAVIGEMLASLDSLTHAGRHHVMSKIVTFVQARVGSAPAGRTPPERARIAEMVEHLQREAARPLPAVGSFTESVQRLLAVPGLFV